LVMGSPGKVRRSLTAIEHNSIERYAERYAGYREVYRAEALARGEQVDWSEVASGAEKSGEWRVASGEKREEKSSGE
jgi:hypothetical protein